MLCKLCCRWNLLAISLDPGILKIFSSIVWDPRRIVTVNNNLNSCYLLFSNISNRKPTAVMVWTADVLDIFIHFTNCKRMIREPKITQLTKQQLWDFCVIPEDTGVRITKEGEDCPVCQPWFSEERPDLVFPDPPANYNLAVDKLGPHLTTMIYCIENYGYTVRWRQKFFCIPDKKDSNIRTIQVSTRGLRVGSIWYLETFHSVEIFYYSRNVLLYYGFLSIIPSLVYHRSLKQEKDQRQPPMHFPMHRCGAVTKCTFPYV